jgi:hypothetical protein
MVETKRDTSLKISSLTCLTAEAGLLFTLVAVTVGHRVGRVHFYIGHTLFVHYIPLLVLFTTAVCIEILSFSVCCLPSIFSTQRR